MTDKLLIDHDPVRVRECRHGLFMYYVNDKYVGRSLDMYGEFSELEAGLFDQILQPGMTALDIGANVGAHTVSMAKKVGPTGQVLAIEPQRGIYNVLCGNLAMNNAYNVTALMVATGNQMGFITVPRIDYSLNGNFGGISLLEGITEGDAVPLITIDSLNIQRCHFIKLDVEGMEQEALEGAMETLKRCRPFLYVENDRRDKSEALIALIMKAGYRLFWHLPPLYNPDNFYGVKEDIFPTVVSINMLCIPQESMPESMANFTEITPENAAEFIYVLK